MADCYKLVMCLVEHGGSQSTPSVNSAKPKAAYHQNLFYKISWVLGFRFTLQFLRWETLFFKNQALFNFALQLQLYFAEMGALNAAKKDSLQVKYHLLIIGIYLNMSSDSDKKGVDRW